MPKIGEILIEHGWVDPTSVSRAISEQRHTKKRLCSLLIARGLLDPDHASRALGEQHVVAAALERHLEKRERELAKLLPAALARSCRVLPIGRMRGGELIVCALDPRPELVHVLTQTVGGKVVLAVAPAERLEPLIDEAYEVASADEYDVDLSTGPITSIDVDISGPVVATAAASLAALERLTLVDLDDVSVAKDFSQTGAIPVSVRGGTLPPTNVPRAGTLPPANVSRSPSASGSIPGLRAQTGPVLPPATMNETLDALKTATTRDTATDAAMRYAGGRWQSSLLLTIKEGAALGHRGHGAQLSADAVQAVVIPLTTPSIVKLAHDTRRLATEPPAGAGAIQDRLSRLLGGPRMGAAAPVVVGPRVACVFAVGDPIEGDAAHAHDLDDLAIALGNAYARVVREKKS